MCTIKFVLVLHRHKFLFHKMGEFHLKIHCFRTFMGSPTHFPIPCSGTVKRQVSIHKCLIKRHSVFKNCFAFLLPCFDTSTNAFLCSSENCTNFFSVIPIPPSMIFLQRFLQSAFDPFPQALGLQHRHTRGEIQGELLLGHGTPPGHCHRHTYRGAPSYKWPDPASGRWPISGAQRAWQARPKSSAPFDFCSKLNPKAATRLFSVPNRQGFGCTLKNACSRKIRCRPKAGSGTVSSFT